MQVKCLAQCLARLRSSTAAHRKIPHPPLSRTAGAIVCGIPGHLSPSASGGPDAGDGYMLDPIITPQGRVFMS